MTKQALDKAIQIRNSAEWQRLKHFVQNTWADGFGNWHATVLEGEGRNGIKARRGAYLAIRLELLERELIEPYHRIKLAVNPNYTNANQTTYQES